MKFSSLKSAFLLTSLGVISLNFSICLPAQASISCEPGNINRYANGFLASCVLGQNTTLQVSAASGISTFPCKFQNYIYFDEKGQFQKCQLSEDIQIKTGNSIEKCPAEFWVNVAIGNDGSLSITCRRY
ncbi:hypothetical protein Nos7524_1623 [Nostoc sp. PCC 7524]|uniref:hypothetical protein n=1 Tax=Nostoc sp. (strain ATCC 29411 / PCC 7524) TaxID=28072 RepID=UPI00029EEF2A|nr:hypothetical protein [Nostoc sp. PCC 7524]AFY47496.1 hypothetical protein Nos7524_1623 [Nostoc sp. PCC 7524]